MLAQGEKAWFVQAFSPDGEGQWVNDAHCLGRGAQAEALARRAGIRDRGCRRHGPRRRRPAVARRLAAPGFGSQHEWDAAAVALVGAEEMARMGWPRKAAERRDQIVYAAQ